MSLLQVNNVSSGYGKKQILFNVSMSVEYGEIKLLLGSNGSGKSTLLKVIYGLLPNWASQGLINFEEREITVGNVSGRISQGMAYVPQNFNVFDGLSVEENMEIASISEKLSKSSFNSRKDMIHEYFPTLYRLKNRNPSNMSGGERQMLAIALGLMHKPKLLLLDEPCAGLAPKLAEQVLSALRAISKDEGIAILMVEHRISLALEIADSLIGLSHGRVKTKFDGLNNLTSFSGLKRNLLDSLYV